MMRIINILVVIGIVILIIVIPTPGDMVGSIVLMIIQDIIRTDMMVLAVVHSRACITSAYTQLDLATSSFRGSAVTMATLPLLVTSTTGAVIILLSIVAGPYWSIPPKILTIM